MKEFEKLIIEKNIKETAYTDLQKYLEIYKEENKEDYSELFQEVKENEVKFVLHSISYVLDDDRYEDEQYKYILVKIFQNIIIEDLLSIQQHMI